MSRPTRTARLSSGSCRATRTGARQLICEPLVRAGEPGADPAFLQARIAAERGMTEAGHGSWFGAFLDRTLVAQLGLVTDGSGIARYQNVETHPAARRHGLAGTLVWHAGQQVLDTLRASTLVIVADPHDVAIRVYRSVGFTDAETQLAFERRGH